MPLASVIIATHARPQLLLRAVESARASASDVEVIVVDDASKDETAELCSRLSGIRYVRIERNQKVAGARNVGIAVSTGEYLTFLDDDDARLPGSLALQVEQLERCPDVGLSYGQAVYGDQLGRHTDRVYPRAGPEGDIFWNLLAQNFIPCGAAVFRRSCVTRLGLLDDTMPGLDDWDLWIRIAELYPIVALREPVLLWRESTPDSKQGTSDAAHLVARAASEFKRSWIKLPKAASASIEIRRAAWRRFSENMLEHLLWQSARALRRGHPLQPLKNCAVIPRLDYFAALRVARHRLSSRAAEIERS